MDSSTLKPIMLDAARAGSIPAGTAGRWSVTKFLLEKPLQVTFKEKLRTIPPGHYTQLFCLTEETMHQPPGEIVMHDREDELLTHLDFMLRARGRVLVTGLGLGCVVRGLLVNPQVEHITVLERDPYVMRLVAPHMIQTPRLEIIETCAFTWLHETSQEFDCAWHDVWNDEHRGDPHLHVMHSDLLQASFSRVKFQGAWQFPRYLRRLAHRTGRDIL